MYATSMVRMLAGMAAGALTAGCSAYGRTQSATGTVPVTPSVFVTLIPALPQRDLALLNRMSDGNILQHVAMSDSLEIVMAQMALRRTHDTGVSSFARMLIADHSMNLQDGQILARQTGITPTTAPGDTSGIMLFRLLHVLNEDSTDFNQVFLRSQVQLHQRELAELQTLQDVARDQDVREHVAATIPVIRKHLARAMDLVAAK